MQREARMRKEILMLQNSPPPGISCWSKDKLDSLEACIVGRENTPFCGGFFKLEIQIPQRYPFEPPILRFSTPIYHPNIDSDGRICLDILKMPPKGGWKPCLNLSAVLTSVQLLMAEPNPDDPLMAEIAREYQYNRQIYHQKAEEWTRRYAAKDSTFGKEKN